MVTRLSSLRISLDLSGIRPGVDPFFRGVSGDDEECRRSHGEADMPIPCFVSADLVVVEPRFILRGLEIFFDRPPASSDAHQFLEVGVGGAKANVVCDLVGITDGTAGQEPVTDFWSTQGPDVNRCPVVYTLAVGPSPQDRRCPSSLRS